MTSDELRERIRRRLEEQRQLVRTLLAQRSQLQGSLFARYGVCGKPGCACQRGRKHGPYYVLSVGRGTRGSFTYLDAGRAERVRGEVARYRNFRSGLRRLARLNDEIVALLKRYQGLVSRSAERRLGLGVGGS